MVMEDDTLASGCAGGAGGGGSTGDGGSVDGRYDACSALHEHVDGVDLCAGSDGDGGDDGWWRWLVMFVECGCDGGHGDGGGGDSSGDGARRGCHSIARRRVG